MTELNDTTFQETVASDTPTLVDFWAPWCGPCRMLIPTIEALATEYEGKANICKLNTDESPTTAGSFGISSIPAVILFKGGQEVERFVGVQPKETYTKALDAAIG